MEEEDVYYLTEEEEPLIYKTHKRTPIAEYENEPREFQIFLREHYSQTEKLKEAIEEWKSDDPKRQFLLDEMTGLDLLDLCYEFTEFLGDCEDLDDREDREDPSTTPSVGDTPELVSPPSEEEEVMSPWKKAIAFLQTFSRKK